jgi:excinuclease ABC subunit C
LLLENNLIKTLNPLQYLNRDDKSYPYLKITGAPIGLRRGGAAFPPSGLLPQSRRQAPPVLRSLPQRVGREEESIQLLQKKFSAAHLRRHGFQQPHSRPCLLYQIKLLGPVRESIAPDDYARDVGNAKRFLLGA